MSESLTYELLCDDLPPGGSHVLRLRVVEELSAPYAAHVVLRVDDPDLDLGILAGKDAQIVIDREPATRVISGLIADVRHGFSAGAGQVQTAELLLTPALTLSSLRRNTRMFQERSAPQILETVLGEALSPYGRGVRLELSGSYARREYTIQYQETDLDFVHRLMEEEGIGYSFDFEGDVETMVLRDRNDAYPSLGPIAYQPSNLYLRGEEPVHDFARRHATRTTSVVVSDWDWTRGGDMRVTAERRATDAVGRDRESYEHGSGRNVRVWDYSPRAYAANDAAHQAKVRAEAHAVDAVLGEGTSRVIALSAGTSFTLSGHPEVGLDGDYLVTRVVHESAIPPRFRQGGEGEAYHNRFECIPLGTPYRRARSTPKPRISGIQTAVVTGPAGEEIHVDEHGRIKVRFHWDRESPADETSSCWIRVQQAWAGDGWGFWWVPRIGMEVVVQFVDGDPDRPIVTGCVYDGNNALPYPLPDEKTKSTIKSRSSLGGGGFNEFRFEDRKGSEEIFTHAQKDYNEVVEHDHDTLVHHCQTNTVDVNQTQVIGANQTETVHGNQVMTVDGDRTVHVKASFDETVDGTETRHVVGDVSETFDANEERTIAGNVTERVRGSESRTVTGGQSETISGSQSSTVSGGGGGTQTIKGALSQTVIGGITVTTPAAYSITAGGGMTITAAAGVTLSAPGGIQVAAPGGVVQVDSKFEWVGVKQLEASGFASGATVLKLETTGFSYGATGVKIEGTLVDISKTTLETTNRGVALRTAANRIGNAAVAIMMAMPHVMI